MKTKILGILLVFLLGISITGCSKVKNSLNLNNSSGTSSNKISGTTVTTSASPASSDSKDKNTMGEDNTVTDEVTFNVMDSKSKPLSDVKIVIINMNGDVIGEAASDKNGYAMKKLTVPIDKRYYWADPNKMEPRGTVTAILSKEGYREQVLFEVPVSPAGSSQEIHLNSIVAGERNEPDVQLGSSHHLEILSLVDKYSEYFKK